MVARIRERLEDSRMDLQRMAPSPYDDDERRDDDEGDGDGEDGLGFHVSEKDAYASSAVAAAP